MNDDQECIRQRAYYIWEAEGRPHGHDRRHWEMACQAGTKNDEMVASNRQTAPQLGDDDPTEIPANPSTRPPEPLQPISPEEPLEPISPIEPVHPNNPETPSDPMASGKKAKDTAGAASRAKPSSATGKTPVNTKTSAKSKQTTSA